MNTAGKIVTPLRIGLIGCGDIGQVRAQAIASCAAVRLAAASDIDEVRAAKVAGQYAAVAMSDWRALVSRADVDAVLVSTPPSLHAEMCIAALESGKHVLCEKPLARNPEECREIVGAARRSGRVLATGFNYRYYPSMQKARQLLDEGSIGELDHIRSYSGYSAAQHSHAWLHESRTMGGGALRDNGIHLIDLTRWFLGEVADVKGFATHHVWNFEGCEDNGFALLQSPEGKVATLQASWTEWRGYRMLIEIYGSRGCIRAWCFPMLTRLTWAAKLGGKPRRRAWYFPWTHVMEHLKSYRWVVQRSFVSELAAFVRAVRGEPSDVATGNDGLRAVEIADAVMGRVDANENVAAPLATH